MSKHDIGWAVRVLNEHEWDGATGWRHTINSRGVSMAEANPREGEKGIPWHLEFEAIAIAEKLERDAGRDMPATRKLIALLAREMEAAKNDGPVLGVTIFRGKQDLLAAVAEWEDQP